MQRRVLFGLGIGMAIGLAAWCLMPDAAVSRRRDLDEVVYTAAKKKDVDV